MCIVEWCNLNSGFLTGVLSLLTLVVSVIAIVISIHTAKLPYKKEIKLSSSIDVFFSRNDTTGETDSQIIGVSVNAANVGSRNVNITYLGICVKDKSLHNGQEKMAKIRDEITGTGNIAPTEVKTEMFQKADLIFALSKLSKKARVYLYAQDTEGREYFQKVGYAQRLIEHLLQNKV